MSKIKNSGSDQYCAEPFKQQRFGTAGVEGVNVFLFGSLYCFCFSADCTFIGKIFATVSKFTVKCVSRNL